VAPAEIEAFYTQYQAQMQGNSLDTMRETIRGFLEQEREAAARDAVVAALKEDGPRLAFALEPPRLAVAITAHDPVRGPAEAPVTLVEFSDYQCPFCGRVTPTLRRLRETYGERLRIVWKDFPLDNHPNAQKAAQAAWCAGEQGRYWEYHDQLFANQPSLGDEALKGYAEKVGLDPAAFRECFESGRYEDRVKQGMADGVALGVDSTPTVFINGRRVTGAQPYEAFAKVVEDELDRAK